MNERDSVRIRHMLDAARSALSFVQGRTREDLDKDEMLAFALTKAVEIVGEAANQVSQTTRNELSTIPWSDIVGMRNRLVHVYFDIDLDVLWQTVAEDLPMLIELVEPLVPQSEST